MNIFYLHHVPQVAAIYHCDKHVVKMIIETAQLLSTAHHEHGSHATYKPTHKNHPSAIWARESAYHYMWLFNLLEECCKEYTHRSDKVHKVERDGLMQALKNQFPINIPDSPFTEPTPAMPEDVKILREVYTDRYELDSLASYRNYYIQNKTHLANWKKRGAPEWYITK
jgi:hypothetical protein